MNTNSTPTARPAASSAAAGPRDFAAEYLAARTASYQAPQFSAEERTHQKRSEAILRAADRAGVDLYLQAISLDTAARVAVFGALTV